MSAPNETNGKHRVQIALVATSFWFGGTVTIANEFNKQLGFIGQPFINVDRWAQGRILFLLIATLVWAGIIGIAFFAPNQRLKSPIGKLILLLWTATLFTISLFLVYHRWP